MVELDVVAHAALIITGIQILLQQLFNHTLDSTSNPEYNVLKEFRFHLRASAITSVWLNITVAAARYIDVDCEMYLVVVFSAPGIIAATRILISFILLCQLSSTESGRPLEQGGATERGRVIKRIIPCSSTVPDYIAIKRRSGAIFVGIVLTHLVCAGVAIYLRFKSYELGADSEECTMDKELPILAALFVFSMCLLLVCLLVFACKSGKGFEVAVAYVRISTFFDLLTLGMFLSINMNDQIYDLWQDSGFSPDIWGILFGFNQVLVPFVIMPAYNWLFVRRGKINRCCQTSCCNGGERKRGDSRGRFGELRNQIDIEMDGHDPSDDDDDSEEAFPKSQHHEYSLAMSMRDSKGGPTLKTVLIPQKSWITKMRPLDDRMNNSIDLFRKGSMELSDIEICWLTCFLIQDTLASRTVYSEDISQAKKVLRSILRKTDPSRTQTPVSFDRTEVAYCKAFSKTYNFPTFGVVKDWDEVPPLEVEMLVREIAFIIALSGLQDRSIPPLTSFSVVITKKMDEVEVSKGGDATPARSKGKGKAVPETKMKIQWQEPVAHHVDEPAHQSPENGTEDQQPQGSTPETEGSEDAI